MIDAGASTSHQFAYRSARSGSLLAGLGLALVVETVVLHLWLAPRHPLLAWTLNVLSLATIGWLAADYHAMGQGALRLSDDALELRIGRRFTALVPRRDVVAAVQPGWRDIPETGTPAAKDYLNLMKPAAPNVLLTLGQPASLRISGGIRRSVRRIGLHVDEPQRLVDALAETSARRAAAPGA